jgi:hypothetical protein
MRYGQIASKFTYVVCKKCEIIIEIIKWLKIVVYYTLKY